MEGDEVDQGNAKKGRRVCVTGGTGFVASWLIMKLLHRGYSVNTTVRSSSLLPQGINRDLSFLTNLPHAPARLRIFSADLRDPESFKPAIDGCVGVFHVAHPQEAESEPLMSDISLRGTLGILQACLDSATVKRVVYTSSAAAVVLRDGGLTGDVPLDETSWSDVDYTRTLNLPSFCVSKTVTERAAIEFAEKHGLDLVSVIPTWIHGPFVCPNLPVSINSSLAMIMGNETQHMKFWKQTPFVHTDDAVEAHIHLFEYPGAGGRFICSAVEASVERMFEIVSSRHPEFQLRNPESVSDPTKSCCLSSKKLMETGFSFRYGLEEMYDDAIQCCKQKGFL